MKIVNIDLEKISEKNIDEIVTSLRKGEVIAYPTDTIYGLGCDASNSEPIKRIYGIKGRGYHKPLLVLISDWNMLADYFTISDAQDKYLRQIWPGPVTAILHKRKHLPKELNNSSGKLAVRLPSSDFLIKIIKRLGSPLVSTSLNKSGEETIIDPESIRKYFSEKNLPDLLIDAGKLRRRKPSKIIEISETGNIWVVRK